MASKLEKVLELLVNEKRDEASALLHEWFVENARKIHQEMMEDDEELDNTVEDEDSVDMDDSDVEDDSEVETDVEDTDDSMDDDGQWSDDEEEEKIEDLEAELEALKAEFEKLDSEDFDDDSEVDSDMDDSEMDDSDEPLDDDSEVDSDMDDSEMDDSEEEVDESFLDEDEDIFDELDESVLDELQSVKADNFEGEVGTGGRFNINKTSPIPQKKFGDRFDAKPVTWKSDNKSGFERETPPSSQKMTDRKNTMSKANSSLSPVRDNSSALLNAKVDGNKFGPISGKQAK